MHDVDDRPGPVLLDRGRTRRDGSPSGSPQDRRQCRPDSAAYHLSRKKRRQIETSMSRCASGRTGPGRAGPDRPARVPRDVAGDPDVVAVARICAGGRRSGLEHLRTGLARGRGVILWESNGFGRRLQSKHVLWTHGIGVHQIHGPNHFGGFLVDDVRKSAVRRPSFSRFFDAQEMLVVSDIVRLPEGTALAHTKRMIDLLGRNAVVCMTGRRTSRPPTDLAPASGPARAVRDRCRQPCPADGRGARPHVLLRRVRRPHCARARATG